MDTGKSGEYAKIHSRRTHVLRAEVLVGDAAVVEVGEAHKDLPQDPPELGLGERPLWVVPGEVAPLAQVRHLHQRTHRQRYREVRK